MARNPSLLCLRGELVVVGKQPDGDSIRFRSRPAGPAQAAAAQRSHPRLARRQRPDPPRRHRRPGDRLWEARPAAAYLTLYSALAPPLQGRLRELARRARDGERGVWGQDDTAAFSLTDQADIGRGGQLVLPKLFRRCSDFLATRTPRETLVHWLQTHGDPNRPEDDQVLVGTILTRLSALVEQRNDAIAFSADLLELVFLEK